MFCLKLAGSRLDVTYLVDEFLIWLVLRKVRPVIVEPGSPYPSEPEAFERIDLLTSNEDWMQTDDDRETGSSEPDAVVKIV